MSKQICKFCGAEIPEGSDFCLQCGLHQRLLACQHCGSPMEPTDDTCPECGKKKTKPLVPFAATSGAGEAAREIAKGGGVGAGQATSSVEGARSFIAEFFSRIFGSGPGSLISKLAALSTAAKIGIIAGAVTVVAVVAIGLGINLTSGDGGETPTSVAEGSQPSKSEDRIGVDAAQSAQKAPTVEQPVEDKPAVAKPLEEKPAHPTTGNEPNEVPAVTHDDWGDTGSPDSDTTAAPQDKKPDQSPSKKPEMIVPRAYYLSRSFDPQPIPFNEAALPLTLPLTKTGKVPLITKVWKTKYTAAKTLDVELTSFVYNDKNQMESMTVVKKTGAEDGPPFPDVSGSAHNANIKNELLNELKNPADKVFHYDSKGRISSVEETIPETYDPLKKKMVTSYETTRYLYDDMGRYLGDTTGDLFYDRAGDSPTLTVRDGLTLAPIHYADNGYPIDGSLHINAVPFSDYGSLRLGQYGIVQLDDVEGVPIEWKNSGRSYSENYETAYHVEYRFVSPSDVPQEFRPLAYVSLPKLRSVDGEQGLRVVTTVNPQVRH